MWCGIWIRWLCLWYPVRGMIPRDSTGTRPGWDLSSYYVYYRLICMLIVVYSSSSSCSATVNERQDICTDFKLNPWLLLVPLHHSLINPCSSATNSIPGCYLYSLPCHIGWPAAAGEDILFRLIKIIVWLAIAPSKNHHPTTRLSIDASRPPLDSWQGW